MIERVGGWVGRWAGERASESVTGPRGRKVSNHGGGTEAWPRPIVSCSAHLSGTTPAKDTVGALGMFRERALGVALSSLF